MTRPQSTACPEENKALSNHGMWMVASTGEDKAILERMGEGIKSQVPKELVPVGVG
jgi:hypothetical protein